MTDLTKWNEDIKRAFEECAKKLNKISKEIIEKLKPLQSTFEKLNEVVNESTKEDKSRRKFEAVACKGRNRKEWWNR